MRQPSKISSIVSPSRRRTIAFFQLERDPTFFPTRRVLPRRLAVHTPSTCTPNSCSTACLIAGLVAFGCTSNVYSCRSWNAAEVFSVITGRITISWFVGIAYFLFFLSPPFFFGAAFLRAADFAVVLRAVRFAVALRAGALWAGLAALRAVFFFAAGTS